MRTVLAVAATLALLAGCADPAPAPPSATELARNFTGYMADYDIATSPAELAARATVVVQGHITKIDKGRFHGISPTDPGAVPQLVMVVEVEQVLHGTLPANAAGKVYVELPAPLAVSADVVDRSAPRQSEVMLYLTPAPSPAELPIANPDAGRPAGQPLYQPVSPQGFVISSGTDMVQILNFATFAGSSISDFAPTATSFP